MKFVGVYNASALVTMMGLFCGLCACWLAFAGRAEMAVVALIWAGIFDLFDGWIARRGSRTQKEADFGIQIDSVVDMVCFGVVPVVIARHMGMDGLLGFIVSILYVCAAAQRLAYFNVLAGAQAGPIRVYTGLPVTFAALIFGIGFLFTRVLAAETFEIFLIILFAVVAFLFVFPAKIPKPKGLVYLLMPVLAVVFTAVWIVLSLKGK